MEFTKQHPYPEDFEEFLDWFQTERDCVEYLAWIRWGDGFACPKCGAKSYWKEASGLWKC